MPPTESLCGRCSSLFNSCENLQALLSEQGYPHHTWEYLSGKDHDCRLCSWIKSNGPRKRPHEGEQLRFTALLVDEKDEISSVSPLNSSWGLETADKDYPLDIRRVDAIVGQYGKDLASRRVFYVYTSPEDSTAEYLKSQSLAYNLADTQACKRALQKLTECFDEHPTCHGRAIPILPTRVIDIGTPAEPVVPRLHIAKQDERASYAALSYCWGGEQPITTTSATIETLKHALPLDLLSLSIKDAIKVTQRLGIQFLWVDALCIIQDDPADKCFEINRMGAIYKNSTITIAAESAKSAKEGFLNGRYGPGNFITLPFYLPNKKHGEVTLCTAFGRHESNKGRYESELGDRAWALQEFLLSPRLLLYQYGDIRWQCQSQDMAPVYPTRGNYERYLPRLPNDVFSPQEQHAVIDSKERDRIWHRIIEQFSTRSITLSEDRLPALAGLANELEIVWQDEYLAGVWKSSLLRSLAWVTADLESPPPADFYIAPSWSWVSANTRVEFSTGEIDIVDAEFVDCSVNATILDSSRTAPSSVRGGMLTLRACSIPASEIVQGPFSEWINPFSEWITMLGCTPHKMEDHKFRYLRLGYQVSGDEKRAVRLLLETVEDSRLYKRIGVVFCSIHEERVWKGITKELITII